MIDARTMRFLGFLGWTLLVMLAFHAPLFIYEGRKWYLRKKRRELLSAKQGQDVGE